MSAGCILLSACVVSGVSLNNFRTDIKKKNYTAQQKKIQPCLGRGDGHGRIY